MVGCSNCHTDIPPPAELDASVEGEESVPAAGPAYPTTLLPPAHDSDMVRLEEQIDEWNVALRHNILVSAGVRACGRAGVRACGRAGVRACGRYRIHYYFLSQAELTQIKLKLLQQQKSHIIDEREK